MPTHAKLADEYKVSPKTIERDGQYATAVDTLAKVGIEPQKVIALEPKAAVVELAKIIAPESEVIPVPLLLIEPVKPKDPALARSSVAQLQVVTPRLWMQLSGLRGAS